MKLKEYVNMSQCTLIILPSEFSNEIGDGGDYYIVL